LALFYCVLGILAMPNEQKYLIATTFDEEKRISCLKEHLAHLDKKIRSKPTALVHIPGESSLGDKKFLLLVVFLVCVYFFAHTQDL
jgi:hypothetical protein